MATMRIKPTGDMSIDDQADYAIFTKKVGRVQVKPRDQQHIRLGEYSAARPAKGFSITLIPEPDLPDMVTTDVVTVEKDDGYELVLHVANYSDTIVSAEVWEMR